jgi:pyruvate ferredoxin oxidoreductase alpha subunit
MVGPEAFAEVRYLSHHKHLQAVEVIPQLAAEFTDIFGRDTGGLIQSYRSEDAETVIVALGSVMGTIRDAVDEMREDGISIGAVKVVSFRPFPMLAMRAALENAQRVIVVEKAFADGLGGIAVGSVRMALRGLTTPIFTIIAGLGGRAITKASLLRAFGEAVRDEIEDPHFLDLNWELIDRELARAKEKRRMGPIAENILRDMGLVGGKPV